MDHVETIRSFISLAGQAIGVLKKGKELMPKGPQRDQVEKTIVEAQQAVELTEIKAAQALGYELCRCTWPPQICLRIDGRDNMCPKCGHNAFHRIGQNEEGGV